MIFFFLGLSFFLVFLTHHFTVQWEWSVLMDEAHFLEWMPYVQDFWSALSKEIQVYWLAGRLTPMKNLMNLAKWNFLPLNANLFHFVDLLIFLASGILICLSFLKESIPSAKKKAFITVAFLGFLFLQRPTLDILALSAIPESYVVLFLALGLYFYPQAFLYRLFFIAAALSKEPAVFALFSTGLVWLLKGFYYKNKKYLLQSCVDFVLFAAHAFFIRQAMQAGTYLAEYSLFDPANIGRYVIGLVKISIGVLPFFFLVTKTAVIDRFKSLTGRERALAATLFFFTFGYLYLVTARLSAGYLVLPSAFMLYSLTFLFAYPRLLSLSWKKNSVTIIAVFTSALVIGAQSFVRYDRFQSSINNGSRVSMALLHDAKIDALLVQGEETAQILLMYKNKYGVKTRIDQLELDDGWKKTLADPAVKNIAIVEYTGYYGAIPEKMKLDLEHAFAPLTVHEEAAGLRIYHANR